MSLSTKQANPKSVPWKAVRVAGGGDGEYQVETRVQVSWSADDPRLHLTDTN
jgi:hypothetical protein